MSTLYFGFSLFETVLLNLKWIQKWWWKLMIYQEKKKKKDKDKLNTKIWKWKVPNYITKLTSKISHNHYVDFVYWVSFIWNIPIHSVQSIHANLLNSFHLNVTFIIQLIHGVITLFNSFQSISFKVNVKSNVNINMKVQSSQLYYKVNIKNIT